MFESIIRLFEWMGDKWRDHASPWVIVRDYEGGVVMRFGRYLRCLHRGVNWRIPFIDYVHTVMISIDTFQTGEINITTTDNKQVVVRAVIEFSVDDPKKNIIDMNDAISNAHDISMGVIADVLTDCDWEEIKRKSTLTKIKNKLKPRFEAMGILVHSVYLSQIATTKVFTVYKN